MPNAQDTALAFSTTDTNLINTGRVGMHDAGTNAIDAIVCAGVKFLLIHDTHMQVGNLDHVPQSYNDSHCRCGFRSIAMVVGTDPGI